MNLHLFATDPSALELLRRLPESDTVTAVVVPENRAGSDKVAALTAAAKVPVYTHRRESGLAEVPATADTSLCWMYSQIIGPEDLARYSKGILNMHGGQIPEYRGASVLQWAIIEGERELGVTWHGLVDAVDAGPIWAESLIPIPSDATAWDLRGRTIEEGLRLFPEAWRRFRNGEAPIRRPDLSLGRMWPQRQRKDGRIDDGWPERRVRDMIRALCPPWPPAFVERNGADVPVCAVLREAAPDSLAYRTSEGHTVYLRQARAGDGVT